MATAIFFFVSCYAARSNNPNVVISCSAGILWLTQYKSCPQELYKLNAQQLISMINYKSKITLL
jgi:hypothetical protein